MKINKTVCILTSGKGTRMGSLGLKLAKALHPMGGKAIISHIIDKFPTETEFIISLGFHGNQVKQYLSIAHKNRKFIFVDVDNYEGPGSGPGHSLLCCKSHLQKPFYFVSCDTLWKNDINWNQKNNWFGVDNVLIEDSSNYCNLKIENNLIRSISDKKKSDPKYFKAFVGLCHINDYKIFWNSLEINTTINKEHQISNGISGLISNAKVHPVNVNWTDVGDEEKYKKELKKFENFNFSKSDEAIYIVNNKVIKFFYNSDITKKRVEKSKIKKNIFPDIKHHCGQFYGYDLVAGETLYKKNNTSIFNELLNWLHKSVWTSEKIESKYIKDSCYKFYKEKTNSRLKLFFDKYPIINQELPVNGESVPSINSILELLPWNNLFNGIATFIHGDLQFDNITYDNEKNKFTLLDWRQDFAGNMNYGDIYYDLAKLYGGIILNYDLIKLNLFNYFEEKNQITIDFSQRYQSSKYIKILEKYINDNKYDLKKVKILVGIIYLNMASLHHAPFDKLLFHLSRLWLYKELKSK